MIFISSLIISYFINTFTQNTRAIASHVNNRNPFVWDLAADFLNMYCYSLFCGFILFFSTFYPQASELSHTHLQTSSIFGPFKCRFISCTNTQHNTTHFAGQINGFVRRFSVNYLIAQLIIVHSWLSVAMAAAVAVVALIWCFHSIWLSIFVVNSFVWADFCCHWLPNKRPHIPLKWLQ